MAESLREELKAHEPYTLLPPERLDAIAQIVDRLRKIDLFESLTTLELAHIAEKAEIRLHEAADLIIRKGDTDQTFFVIVRGQVRVWERGENGRARLLNYHSRGDFFGELAPLDDIPRQANVDAVEDVELVAFGPEGFDRIIQHRQVSEYLRTWGQERIRRSNRLFEGKHWDEITIVLAHKSWLALARMVLLPLGVLFVTWLFFVLFLTFTQLSREFLVSITLAVTVGMSLWIFWIYEDWRNDDLIVTSKRIIHIERVLAPPFPFERHEAAITQVQDVKTSTHGMWTSLFKVRSLEVHTTGGGTIQFPYLDDADQIRDAIFHARDLARVRRTGAERSRIRHSLLSELERPVKPVESLFDEQEPEVTPEPRGILRLVDYFVPRIRIVKSDRIIWRQHWLVLALEGGPAAFLVVFFGALLVIAAVRPGGLRQVPLFLALPLPVLGIVAASVWYLWVYDGWRSHEYIVTDERIIDIEGTPFGLRGERRIEGPFETIQNTEYSSPSALFRILSIGDVTIDTASQLQAYTFDLVSHPERVQQEIFNRLIAYRERKEKEAAERHDAEFTKWFGAYHRSVAEEKEQ